MFYSIWHVGTEKKIFSGPASCSGINTNSSTLEELKENIANQSLISCGDITWYLFGKKDGLLFIQIPDITKNIYYSLMGDQNFIFTENSVKNLLIINEGYFFSHIISSVSNKGCLVSFMAFK